MPTRLTAHRSQQLLLGLLVGLLMLPVMGWAAEDDEDDEVVQEAPKIEDLYTSRYQNFALNINGRVLQNKGQSRNVYRGNEYERLLSSLFTSHTLHVQAERLAAPILKADLTPKGQDHALFILGHRYMRAGNHDRAEKAWDKVGRHLSKEEEALRRLGLAVIYMERDEDTRAGRILKGTNPRSIIGGIVPYNRGVAEIKAGKAQLGSRSLLKVADLQVTSAATLALRDRTLLALGTQLQKSGDRRLAKQALERMSLKSAYADQGLLALAWHYYRVAEQDKALALLNRLKKYSPAKPAVQRGLVLKAKLLEEMGAERGALEVYLDAAKTFAEQIEQIDASLSTIRAGGIIKSMGDRKLAEALPKEDDWLLPEVYPADRRELKYIGLEISKHKVNEAYRNFRRLRFLFLTLEAWGKDPKIYLDVLKKSGDAFRIRSQAIQTYMSMRQKRPVSASIREWVFGKEQANRQAYNVFDERVARLVGKAPQAQQIRLLKGLSRWETRSASSKLAKAIKQKRLKSQPNVIKELELFEKRWLEQALASVPAYHKALRKRAKFLQKNLENITEDIEVAVEGQDEFIQDILIQGLVEKRIFLENNLLNASLAIARIYDEIVVRMEQGS